MWFLPSLLKVTNLGWKVTLALAVLMGLGASADWLRKDAVRDAEAIWKLEQEKAHTKLVEEAFAKQKQLDKVTKILEATELEAQRLQGENTKLLGDQRNAVPLSEACSACRVPNERLWLRGQPKAAGASAKGS